MSNIHHLRVVNFDKVLSENEETSKNTRILFNDVLRFDDKVGTINEATNKEVDIPKNNLQNVSENIRSDNEDNKITTKTWSFDDIREKIKSNIHGPKVRQNGHKKTMDRRLNRAQYKKNVISQDDIKVLYNCERFINQTSSKTFSKTSLHKRSMSQKFATNKGKYHNNTYLCYQTCRNTGLFPTPKRRKKKSESKAFILHTVYPFGIKRNKSKKSMFCKKPKPEHYSLVGFPLEENESLNVSQQVIWKDEVPPLQIIDCNNNTTTSVSKFKVEPVRPKICPRSAEKIVTVDRKVSQCYLNQDEAVCRFFDIFRCVFMYILVILIIVIWLPCIVIGGICWFIISLMRPQEITIEQHITCDKPSKCKQKIHEMNQWISCNAERFSLMVQKLMNNENTTCTRRPHFHQLSMPTMPCQITGFRKKNLCKNRSKWEPNPGKKYILYYNNERGWLMKPVDKEAREQSRTHGFSHKRPKRDRTVTFWDAHDHGACKCDHGAGDRIIDKCTQVTCKDPITQKPTCGVCSHEVVERREGVRRKYRRMEGGRTDEGRTEGIIESGRLEGARIEGGRLERGRIEGERIEGIPIPKSKLKNLFIPCPTARPCPVRTRKEIVQQKKQNEALKRLSSKARSQRLSIRDTHGNEESLGTARVVSAKDYRKALKDGDETTKKPGVGKIILEYFVDGARNMKNGISAAEDDAWGDGIQCGGNLYVSTLKKRPCFWIHRRWPNMYPLFLAWHKVCSHCCYGCMFICAACVWCPLFFCCYLFYTLICMCCGGGCDCNC